MSDSTLTPQEATADVNPKDVFRELGCYIARMDKDKHAKVPRGFSMSPAREPQTLKEFELVKDADRWAILPLKESNLVILDQDSGVIDMQIVRYFNRLRRKYVTMDDSIESRHGFLRVIDANHEWCADFAKRFHKQVQGLEIYAEKHWVIYEGGYSNPGDPTMLTEWHGITPNVVIDVSREELEDVFGRLVPHVADAQKRHGAKTRNRKVAVRVAAGQGNRHMALIGLAFDVYVWLFMERRHLKQGGPVTVQMMYDRIMADGRDRIEGVNEYESGDKRRELDDIIAYVLQAQDDASGESKTDPRSLSLSMGRRVITDMIKCAHILKSDERGVAGRDVYNCWYWDGSLWDHNTEFEIMRLLLTMQAENLLPTSRMAKSITEVMAASESTMMCDLLEPSYVQKMQHIILNTFGEYFDLLDGSIHRINPDKLFFEQPHMQVRFTGEVETNDVVQKDENKLTEPIVVAPVEMDITNPPTEVFRCMRLWFSQHDMDILLDHLAGSLLHASILGSKPKILYVVGQHNTFKSMWVALMQRVLHPKAVSSVSAVEMSERFGMSLIAERILNMKEEQDAVNVDSPGALKDAITRISGPVTQKYAVSQIHCSRFPRHLIMCNMVQPISYNDEDDSIFVRSQYITTKNMWDSPDEEAEARNTDWYKKIVKDDAEVKRFALWLLKRAHEICVGKHEIVQQSLDESRKAYHSLMHGTFEQFLTEAYEVCDESVGVLWRRLYNDYRKAAKSNIDYKKFRNVLTEGGYESVKGRFYKTDVKDVLTEMYGEWHTGKNMERSDTVQATIIQGLVPKGMVPACAGGEGGSFEKDENGDDKERKVADKTQIVIKSDGVEQTTQRTSSSSSKEICTCCGHENKSVCVVRGCTCCTYLGNDGVYIHK